MELSSGVGLWMILGLTGAPLGSEESAATPQVFERRKPGPQDFRPLIRSSSRVGGKLDLGLPVPFPRDAFEGAATAKFVFPPGGES